jgi:hypothetical protein
MYVSCTCKSAADTCSKVVLYDRMHSGDCTLYGHLTRAVRRWGCYLDMSRKSNLLVAYNVLKTQMLFFTYMHKTVCQCCLKRLSTMRESSRVLVAGMFCAHMSKALRLVVVHQCSCACSLLVLVRVNTMSGVADSSTPGNMIILKQWGSSFATV